MKVIRRRKSLQVMDKIQKQMRMQMQDGVDCFPNSVVEYTEFCVRELQNLFAMFRQMEDITQKDIARLHDCPERQSLVRKLHFIQGVLIWMAHNPVNGFAPVSNWRQMKARNKKATDRQGRLL